MQFHSKTFLLASILLGLTKAQTYTACDPLLRTDCPSDPAMPATLLTDLRQGAQAFAADWDVIGGDIDFSKDGAQLAIKKRGQYTTMISKQYLFFGYVEAKIKVAPGQGIVTAMVLQSDVRDEVDWEFIGTVKNSVQTNYFGKGNTTTYDRRIDYPTLPDNQAEFHTYALNWTASSLDWFIDGTKVRTLKYEQALGGRNYPQTPFNVRIGVWAGGDYGNNEGTISWAGGRTNYSNVPFAMTVQSVKVINYSPGKEYKYTDKSGSFKSIQVIAKDVVTTPNATTTIQSIAGSSTVPVSSTLVSSPSSFGQSTSTTFVASFSSQSISASSSVPSSSVTTSSSLPSTSSVRPSTTVSASRSLVLASPTPDLRSSGTGSQGQSTTLSSTCSTSIVSQARSTSIDSIATSPTPSKSASMVTSNINLQTSTASSKPLEPSSVPSPSISASHTIQASSTAVQTPSSSPTPSGSTVCISMDVSGSCISIQSSTREAHRDGDIFTPTLVKSDTYGQLERTTDSQAISGTTSKVDQKETSAVGVRLSTASGSSLSRTGLSTSTCSPSGTSRSTPVSITASFSQKPSGSQVIPSSSTAPSSRPVSGPSATSSSMLAPPSQAISNSELITSSPGIFSSATPSSFSLVSSIGDDYDAEGVSLPPAAKDLGTPVSTIPFVLSRPISENPDPKTNARVLNPTAISQATSNSLHESERSTRPTVTSTAGSMGALAVDAMAKPSIPAQFGEVMSNPTRTQRESNNHATRPSGANSTHAQSMAPLKTLEMSSGAPRRKIVLWWLRW